MKKTITSLLIMILILSLPFVVFAKESEQIIETQNEVVECFEDGSYIVTEILENKISFRATGVTKSKTVKYYNSNDELEWSVSISGTFNYNGSSASCTNAVASYKIYNDRWKVTASSASRSGATARGDFTIKKYFLGVPTKTVNEIVTLTCSKTGVFS